MTHRSRLFSITRWLTLAALAFSTNLATAATVTSPLVKISSVHFTAGAVQPERERAIVFYLEGVNNLGNCAGSPPAFIIEARDTSMVSFAIAAYVAKTPVRVSVYDDTDTTLTYCKVWALGTI